MTEDLRKTPFHPYHERAGAKLVEFAGFEMPLQFQGIVKEHHAVRESAGLFDVSHMGEAEIRGPAALDLVQELITNDAAALVDGQALYTTMCKPHGGIIDDVLVYRLTETRYMLVLNAANAAKDIAWMKVHQRPDAQVIDRCEETAQLALQGRNAEAILDPLSAADLSSLAYYHFVETTVAGQPALVSRTGYTGEDGFEIYMMPESAGPVWEALFEQGEPQGLVPVGLGARDTLRLEMKMALYGNDITEDTTPLEAGLGWVTKLDKPGFIGKEALVEQKSAGLQRRLVAFELTTRSVPRHGYKALIDGEEVGEVTSGAMSPSLNKPIGLAYLPRGHWKPGSTFQVQIRKKAVDAVVVKPPFYERPY